LVSQQTRTTSITYHSHAFYSLHLPRRQPRFKNDLIVLENSKAESYDHILRPQNFPTFQLNLNPGRVVPYHLNCRIQHDSETIRIIGMVKERMSLPLDKALEPTLIYAEMVFLREPARPRFECEVVRLEGISRVGPTWKEYRGDSPMMMRSKMFVLAFVHTRNRRYSIPRPFLEGSGVSTRQWSTRPEQSYRVCVWKLVHLLRTKSITMTEGG